MLRETRRIGIPGGLICLLLAMLAGLFSGMSVMEAGRYLFLAALGLGAFGLLLLPVNSVIELDLKSRRFRNRVRFFILPFYSSTVTLPPHAKVAHSQAPSAAKDGKATEARVLWFVFDGRSLKWKIVPGVEEADQEGKRLAEWLGLEFDRHAEP